MSTKNNLHHNPERGAQNDEYNVLTISDALTTEQEGHGHTSDRGGDRPPIGCPCCGHELEPGPYGTWICWRCRETLTVHGGRR